MDVERINNTFIKSRRTKIIATLGPSSNTKQTIRDLIYAGANIFRLNMSHGSHESHRELFYLVRLIAEELKLPIAIVVDLCGPKIRVGRVQDGTVFLQSGQEVTITSSQLIGTEAIIPSQYQSIHLDVNVGDRILLDDGNIELEVLYIHEKDVICKVKHGGKLSDNKGINLPDSQLSTPSFTSKDKEDALLAIELNADFVALSFVRRGEDIKQFKEFMLKNGKEIPVISKIERPEALDNIEDIIDLSYAIMVARGDLGIELPIEKVPLLQRDLITRAKKSHVPVIVATQMLESMTSQSKPTRAEVSDVANAAQTSTDAVMLSAETASGSFPVESVKTMDLILRETELQQWKERRFGSGVLSNRRNTDYSIREAMAHAAVELARDLKLEAIIIPTQHGTTARIMAAHRAISPMIGVCSSQTVFCRLAIHWGVIPVLVSSSSEKDWRLLCENIENQSQLLNKNSNVLIIAGFNDDPTINEPVLKIIRI